jgi:NitT/TauT family transport system permease protein
MPYLIAGHKLALGRAWRAVIGGEIFASTKYGIGFMVFDARTFLDTPAMFAGLIMVGLIGFVLEKVLFRYIERVTIVRWGLSSEKEL